MMVRKKFYRAFTLVEILGAVAVVSTLAVLVVVSAKDMVLSGQRSAVQRELQILNGALQQFRAAGGVIPDDASAEAAVRKLRDGVGIEGGNYVPLTTNPKMSMEIGGVPYELSYDPDPGFSYVNADGEGMGLAGGELTPTPGAGVYPFDITDPLAVASALDELDMLDPDSPEYQDYLNALGAAVTLGTLTEGGDLYGLMGEKGYTYDAESRSWVKENVEEWVNIPQILPVFPEETWQLMELLENGATWADFDYIMRMVYIFNYPEQAIAEGGVEALPFLARSSSSHLTNMPIAPEGVELFSERYRAYWAVENGASLTQGYAHVLSPTLGDPDDYPIAESHGTWASVAIAGAAWDGSRTVASVSFQAMPQMHYLIYYRSPDETYDPVTGVRGEWKFGGSAFSESGDFAASLTSKEGADLTDAWNAGNINYMLVPYLPQ